MTNIQQEMSRMHTELVTCLAASSLHSSSTTTMPRVSRLRSSRWRGQMWSTIPLLCDYDISQPQQQHPLLHPPLPIFHTAIVHTIAHIPEPSTSSYKPVVKNVPRPPPIPVDLPTANPPLSARWCRMARQWLELDRAMDLETEIHRSGLTRSTSTEPRLVISSLLVPVPVCTGTGFDGYGYGSGLEYPRVTRAIA